MSEDESVSGRTAATGAGAATGGAPATGDAPAAEDPPRAPATEALVAAESVAATSSAPTPAGPPVSLRPFIESDDAEVSSWFADAGELRFFAGRRLSWPLDSGQWRSIRLDPSVSAWTAILGDDNTPVGHAELVTESPSVVRLARYAVSPAFRERGLGRAILKRLLLLVRNDGFTTLRLAAHPDNSTAIRAYRTFGFEFEEQPAVETGMMAEGSAERMLMSLRFDA